MRRRCAATFVLIVVVLSVLIATPAQAGGPTSVLLVVPGAGQTASLYNSEDDYAALAKQVGAFAVSGEVGKQSASSHEVGVGVTVTWLIHDVQIWRVDRIYPGAKGGPWISTQLAAGGSDSIWDSPPAWHTATNGVELISLLNRLGVGPASPRSASAPDYGGNVPASGEAPAAATPAAAAAAKTEPGGWAGLTWGLLGLALGVVITLGAARLSPTARRLTDEEVSTRGQNGAERPDPELTWSSAEELSSPRQ